MKRLLSYLALTTFIACTSPQPPSIPISTTDSSTVKTGGSQLIDVDGKYKVWTKKAGNGKIKVLLLHGGPGIPHDYLECFEDFLPKEGMEIYFYDQLGCGNSDIPNDTSLWHLPRFVEEVEAVRKGLKLDEFYIFGHSWGTMLAMEYVAKYPSHVKGAVFSNMTAGMQSFTAYLDTLKNRLLAPAEKQTFDSLDKAKQYDSPLYGDLLMNRLYANALCRIPVEQWPEPLMRSLKKVSHAVYVQMQGVDEFHVTGNFRNWEFWDRLPEIKVPALVIGAVHDEMNPEDIKREGRLLPMSRTYICPEGSHLSMYDDQQRYFSTLISFLKEVDGGTFKPDAK
jgi:proline iminopeptidase